LNEPNCWGIDEMWCGAASQYNANKTSCALLPVVSVHDDTRQVPKTNICMKHGQEHESYWKITDPFATWFQRSQNWEDIAHNYIDIEYFCSMIGENSTNFVWICDKS
jgi:hypothetical protein